MSNDESITVLGRAIDELLAEAEGGIDAKTLAQKAEINPSTITHLRKGKYSLTDEVFQKIVTAYPSFRSKLSIYVNAKNEKIVAPTKEFKLDDDGIPIKGQVKIVFGEAGGSLEFSDGSHPTYIKDVARELGELGGIFAHLKK